MKVSFPTTVRTRHWHGGSLCVRWESGRAVHLHIDRTGIELTGRAK